MADWVPCLEDRGVVSLVRRSSWDLAETGAVIILTSSSKQFRLAKVEVC